jgi:hypothetical protein
MRESDVESKKKRVRIFRDRRDRQAPAYRVQGEVIEVAAAVSLAGKAAGDLGIG